MNVHNKNYFLVTLLCLISFLSFSQKKDAYFLLDKNNPEYVIPSISGSKENLLKKQFIKLKDRKEYVKHQKAVKKAKEKGTYYYDPESGTDNTGVKVSHLEYEILSKKVIQLNSSALKQKRTVDYNWILEESWKPINPRLHKVDFKNLYFLYKLKGDTYVSYKVSVIVSAH